MERIIYKFKDFLGEHFPYPVRKLPIHTNLGCPHRISRTGAGGCIYCYNPGFSNVKPGLPDVFTQIQNGIDRSRQRGFTGKFIAYFQTDTNTYANIDKLEPWWRTIDLFPEDVVGFSVSTRPDCLSQEMLVVLNDIARNKMVWVELGLQSVHDRTLELINRGHDYACFVQAVKQIQQFEHLLICAHIILGLPGETEDDMKMTIRELNKLNLHGVKIHHLQVVKHTILAKWYERGDVRVFSENDYIRLLIELLPYLSSKIVVHRLVGDIMDDLLIAPRWKQSKIRIIQLVEDQMKEAGCYQGMKAF